MSDDYNNNNSGDMSESQGAPKQDSLGIHNAFEDLVRSDLIEHERNHSESPRKRRHRRSAKKQKKPKGSLFFISIFILSIGLITGGYYAYEKYMPNFLEIPLHKFYSELNSDKIYIVIGDKRIETKNHPVKKDDSLYIPVDFVKEYIDKYIFWDETVGRLTITTENKVIQMKTEELSYFVNNKPFNLNLPVYNIDSTAYMPADMLIDLYDITIQYDEQYNHTIIDYNTEEKLIYKVIKDKTNLRYEADIKSPIQEKLSIGDSIVFFGDDGDFAKIRTSNGLIGYVNKKDIEPDQIIPPALKQNTMQDSKDYLPKGGKINIIWDQITTAEASSNEERRINHRAIDVLSPTWFSFDTDKLNGDIVNIADKGYVDWAHKNGYQVWALISDNFNEKVSHAILSDTAIREYVIKQLLAFVSMYRLDGINIDFENVKKQDADYYIQFLRELYPMLREQGIVLSVDMYVPKPYNLYYNRTEVANACDYIIIMGYDEHYSGSEVSGPVASIGFVEEGIFETLKEAPKERVILGLPYFMRVWGEVESDGEVTVVSSKAYSRDAVKALFKENDAEFTWLEGLGCYYAEYVTTEDKDGVTRDVKYRVWLEDESSLEAKLKLVDKYDLAGVSGWSANWLKAEEKNDFLELIDRYMK